MNSSPKRNKGCNVGKEIIIHPEPFPIWFEIEGGLVFPRGYECREFLTGAVAVDGTSKGDDQAPYAFIRCALQLLPEAS